MTKDLLDTEVDDIMRYSPVSYILKCRDCDRWKYASDPPGVWRSGKSYPLEYVCRSVLCEDCKERPRARWMKAQDRRMIYIRRALRRKRQKLLEENEAPEPSPREIRYRPIE